MKYKYLKEKFKRTKEWKIIRMEKMLLMIKRNWFNKRLIKNNRISAKWKNKVANFLNKCNKYLINLRTAKEF
jgi:hypothetical protein